MARMTTVVETSTGWSDWIAPNMTGYRMACCDCGLVHDMEFGVFTAVDIEGKSNWHRILKKDVKNGRVRFRARRNNRSTAAVRRKRHA